MLLDYIAAAMRSAGYEKLADGTFCGTVKKCPGVIAFAGSQIGRASCRERV
jgi:hypothetical protein